MRLLIIQDPHTEALLARYRRKWYIVERLAGKSARLEPLDDSTPPGSLGWVPVDTLDVINPAELPDAS